MKRTIVLIVFLLIPGTKGLLYAEDTSFRCGNDLISIGYTMFQVKDSCGQPDMEQNVGQRAVSRVHRASQSEAENTVYITEWTYQRDFGIYILTFEGDRLIKKEYKRLE